MIVGLGFWDSVWRLVKLARSTRIVGHVAFLHISRRHRQPKGDQGIGLRIA